MSAIYSPQVFEVTDIESAKRIILTPEGITTAERWANETPYLVDLLIEKNSLSAESVVLDYGCGIGRISKELIRRISCSVVGVDISTNMRALAASYVESDQFFSCSPRILDVLIAQGLRVDSALAVWVLQHCFKPDEDLARISASLKPSATLFVVNQRLRAVPIRGGGWANDGLDIRNLLCKAFHLVREEHLSASKTNDLIASEASWSIFSPSVTEDFQLRNSTS